MDKTLQWLCNRLDKNKIHKIRYISTIQYSSIIISSLGLRNIAKPQKLKTKNQFNSLVCDGLGNKIWGQKGALVKPIFLNTKV